VKLPAARLSALAVTFWAHPWHSQRNRFGTPRRAQHL